MQEQTDNTKDYVGNILDQIVEGVPKFLGALAILLIGYIIAKIVAGIVRKTLEAAKLNDHLQSAKGGNVIQKAIPNPSSFVSKIVFWLLFLFTLSVAVSALGIPALVQIVQGIYAYIPNIIAAFIIFLVAGAVSAAVSGLVASTMGDTPTGKIMASAAPVIVMGLATFMILNQLKIAPEIVTITYAGLVATATLAFGLGGKDAASQMFMGLYQSGQQKKSAVASDFQKGASTAKDKAQDLKNKV
jgi:hypothetical protein